MRREMTNIYKPWELGWEIEIDFAGAQAANCE
jgi:hypothetical protein